MAGFTPLPVRLRNNDRTALTGSRTQAVVRDAEWRRAANSMFSRRQKIWNHD